MDKFKLIAFGIVAVFAVVLIGGFLYLEAAGRPTSTFLLFGSTILGNLAIFGGLGYAQSKQGEQLKTIKSQTNGTLSKLQEDNARLHEVNARLHEENAALREKRAGSGEVTEIL